jgi:hypothetical protein
LSESWNLSCSIGGGVIKHNDSLSTTIKEEVRTHEGVEEKIL